MAEKTLTYEAAFPGRFLKAALFEGKRVTLTIESAFMEVLEGDKGKDNKLILTFVGKTMQLVCNKTNALCLKEMWGNKVPDWVGKRVTFYPTDTSFGPKKVDCIRVYGSPDIAEDIDVACRIGRKNFKTTLHAIKSAAGPIAVADKKDPDPRILLSWSILDWKREEGDKHRLEIGGSDADYLAVLSGLIDNQSAAEEA